MVQVWCNSTDMGSNHKRVMSSLSLITPRHKVVGKKILAAQSVADIRELCGKELLKKCSIVYLSPTIGQKVTLIG